MLLRNKHPITTTGFAEDAFVALAAGDVLVNLAPIHTSGDYSNGVYVGFDRVHVRNLDLIETVGEGARGIRVRADDVQVVNRGTILTKGDAIDPDPATPGDETTSDGISVTGARFSVRNSGLIEVSGTIASAIFGEGDGGRIRNSGVARSSGSGAGIVGAIGADAHVVNTGMIEGSADNQYGIQVDGNGGLGWNRGDISTTGVLSFGMTTLGTGNLLRNGGHISVSGDFEAIGIFAEGDGHKLVNEGTITANGFVATGMWSRGAGQSMINEGSIVSTGLIARGMLLFGPDHHAVNDGLVRLEGDGGIGILGLSDGARILNTGEIRSSGGIGEGAPVGPTAAHAISASGIDVLVQNEGSVRSERGESAAVALGVVLFPGTDISLTYERLENSGTVAAPLVAVLGGDGRQQVVNGGGIWGDVSLGGGDDVFAAASGGRLHGVLTTGAGDDLIVVERDSGWLRVGDFQAGEGSDDRVDLSAFHLHGFGEMLGLARQTGDGVVIALAEGSRLVLQGQTLGDLVASDFVF